jgi:hypothetical protein
VYDLYLNIDGEMGAHPYKSTTKSTYHILFFNQGARGRSTYVMLFLTGSTYEIISLDQLDLKKKT